MLEKIEVKTKGNDSKCVIRSKRKKGLIPVNLYGPGIKENGSYYIDELVLNKAVKSGKKVHPVVTESGDFNVVFKEIQRHPVSWKLVHVDLLTLAPGVKVVIKVPVRYRGVPFGVKNMGGVFIINAREVEIEALPEHIPDEIEIDISPMKVKDTIHASDIERENIRIVSPPGMLLSRVGITRAAVSAAGDGVEGETGQVEEGTEGGSESSEGQEEKPQE